MLTKIEDIMVRDVKTTGSEETILKATEIMNKFEIGCVVVTEKGNPVGIVTERDILKRVVFERRDPAKTRLSEVMSKPLVTVKPDVTVAKAARLMIKAKIKKLPVADSDHLLGILSLTDLVPLLKEEASTTKFRISDAPDRVKRVFETFIDPETHQRKKCPLIILGGMPVGCLGSKCMWYDAEGCVFKTFTMKLAATRSDHQQ